MKLLQYPAITDITDTSTDIDTDIISVYSLMNSTDADITDIPISVSIPILILILVHLY